MNDEISTRLLITSIGLELESRAHLNTIVEVLAAQNADRNKTKMEDELKVITDRITRNQTIVMAQFAEKIVKLIPQLADSKSDLLKTIFGN